MARGSKKKYTSKQKRKADHKGYEKRGVSAKEAEPAWATVNKSGIICRDKAESIPGFVSQTIAERLAVLS